MGSFQSVAVETLLAADKGISVGVMYPGDDTTHGVPLIRVGDIIGNRISSHPGFRISRRVHEEYRRTALQGGECLITLVGRPGVTLVVPPEMRGWNVARALAVVRLKEPEDARFFTYSMSAPAVQNTIENWCNTTVQATLNLKEIKALTVPWPERRDRQRIVEVLGSLDDKIELNRRMNETLEAMAQAIFRDWFVDFGPTRRKREGAADPITIMGGLVQDIERAQALADLFPDVLGDDGLPEGWKTVELAESFDTIMGQSPPGSSYNEDGVGLPFFQGRRDFGFRFPQNRVYCTSPSRIAEEDWTLVSVRAPVGDVNRSKERCCIGRGVGSVFHKQNLPSLTYYTVLELKPLFARFDGDGTVFGSINQKQVKSLPVVRASLEIMHEFEALVSPMDKLVRTKSDEMDTLAATRDFLLPKLISGEICLDATGDMIK